MIKAAETPRRRVTLADVSARAGVDRSIVSRVMNDDKTLSIRGATRDRVLEAVRHLGYRPNAAARSLRTARTGTLGLFLPDFTNPVYAEIIAGAETAAASRGYVLVTGSSTLAGVNPRTYLNLLGEGRVDGLLLAGATLSPDVQKTLTELGLPYLLLNRRLKGSRRYVVLDDQRAARMAVDHLLGLGHTRIAYLAGPPGADTSRRRRAGYLAALKAGGIDPEPELTANGDYTAAGGVTGMTALLAQGRRPTAVVAANYTSALGAIRAVRDSGMSVPEDISIVTIHDSPMANYLVPPLTTVRMPLELLGSRSVELLISREAHEDVQEVLSGPMDLIVRESTRRLDAPVRAKAPGA